ncbi:TPA: GNAT family N-acetyltransferase [Legionella pneumophila]|uniref:GNAT family N-acetyltransferase n=1 Tax=Legionella sp. PATHC039 TaxID=2992042 RepID=UPI0009B3E1BD|nr:MULTISPECIES: GNAT family N-acetyltransferase [Legionella]HAT8859846.1 GNAT family N-acetyltransferase [Legionella pneumophila subsp. pneumophila]MCW8395842.1 GNAT family N-acetyltransferase [Legionella sp. PATHC039]HAT7072934.1 GNAT family N-acetyltransferase [Legionella pneumophila]HAT8641688.1 GNAT family N-acetyltransferase [Legionella pneumophila]HAT8867413.1 GNAT family N-acetyltransferase [Legionella pneumophila subsp. pneumophila]
MKITFKTLSESDFTLLLKWLEERHVKAWWDQDVKWTSEQIQKKYGSYVKGYKIENNEAKSISAYIIYVDEIPIGYIQVYNAYDFARSTPLIGLPSSLAAFDVFIGEKNFLNKGIGSKAIDQFLKEYAHSYTHVFADPDNTNSAAIRAYEKVGFKKINKQPTTGELWLIREQISLHTEELPKLIYKLELSLLNQTIRQSKSKLNQLIADEFVEFGKSGKVYKQHNILDSLPFEKTRTVSVLDFEVKELSQNVILAMYKAIENDAVSLRSSIWKLYGDEWRIIFHQGTKIPEACNDHKK